MESETNVVDVITKMTVLEDSMNAFMKQNNEQLKVITETLGSVGKSSSRIVDSTHATAYPGLSAPVINQNLRNVQAPMIGSPNKRKKMDDGEVLMTPIGQEAPVDNTYAKIAGNNLMAQTRFGAQVQGIQQKSRKRYY